MSDDSALRVAKSLADVLRGGYLMTPKRLIYAPIRPTSRLVLMAILDHYRPNPDNPDDEVAAWPGEKRLAELLSISRETVSDAIKQLQTAGLLKVTRRGRTLTNMYEVTDPEEWPAPNKPQPRTPLTPRNSAVNVTHPTQESDGENVTTDVENCHISVMRQNVTTRSDKLSHYKDLGNQEATVEVSTDVDTSTAAPPAAVAAPDGARENEGLAAFIKRARAHAELGLLNEYIGATPISVTPPPTTPPVARAVPPRPTSSSSSRRRPVPRITTIPLKPAHYDPITDALSLAYYTAHKMGATEVSGRAVEFVRRCFVDVLYPRGTHTEEQARAFVDDMVQRNNGYWVGRWNMFCTKPDLFERAWAEYLSTPARAAPPVTHGRGGFGERYDQHKPTIIDNVCPYCFAAPDTDGTIVHKPTCTAPRKDTTT